MTDTILKIDRLRKTYGSIVAVDGLDLEIGRGQVYGLLGPNGSGKSTTLGMALGVTVASSGQYAWFGKQGGHAHRKCIGAILEKPNFYPNFSAVSNLEIACKIKDISIDRIPAVLSLVGLTERQHSTFRTFSLGMKQRLAIASALLADPEVLVLDEPTNGLDPQGIADIRRLIIDIAHTGKTIILASHLLDEVQKVCTHFAILQKGHLVHTGRVDADFGEEVIIQIGSKTLTDLASVLEKQPGYLSHRELKDRLEVKMRAGTSAAQLNQQLVQSGLAIELILPIKKTLEQQFIEITGQR